MKKNLRLLLISFVLVALAILVYFSRNSSAFDESDSKFAIDDTTTVTRFFMADKKGRSVLISRDSANGGWLVNHSSKGHKMIIESFLGVASQLAVESPVAEKASANILKIMAANAIKVEIYQMKPLIDWFGLNLFLKERLTKTYYVGDVARDNIGTYMLMEGSSIPFIVYQPGFRGFVQARYFTNPSDWRDHTIFAIQLDQLKSVKMSYPETPEHSFSIVNNGNRTLSLSGGIHFAPVAPFDTLKALSYLTAFNSVKFEAFLSDINPHKRDSIISSQPFFRLNVIDNDGRENSMTAWRMEVGEANTELYGNQFNMDRMYALVGKDSSFVMIQYFVFDKYLRILSDFSLTDHKLGNK